MINWDILLHELDTGKCVLCTGPDLYSANDDDRMEKRLAQNVKLKIQQASHFIFLGMPMDKWYFHLFMRVLNMHRDTTKSKRLAATYSVNGANATFCEEQYTLTFIQQGTGDFMRTLTEKWKAAREQKTGMGEMNVFERWRQQVQTGEDIAIRGVFAEIKPLAEQNDDLNNQRIIFEMQWNGFTSHAFETEMAKNAMKTQVLKGILSLIAEIEKHNPEGKS